MGWKNGGWVRGITVKIGATGSKAKEQAFQEWLTPESTWEAAEVLFGISRTTFYKWRGLRQKQSADCPRTESAEVYADG